MNHPPPHGPLGGWPFPIDLEFPGLLAQTWGSPVVGKWVFAAVFGVLILWLLLIPGRLIGQAESVPPWYRNVRVWAIFVAALQMLIYLLWGQSG